MKTRWTVALVIAASLAAQGALAGDGRQSEPGLSPLFRLLASSGLDCPDDRLGGAIARPAGGNLVSAAPACCCTASLDPAGGSFFMGAETPHDAMPAMERLASGIQRRGP